VIKRHRIQRFDGAEYYSNIQLFEGIYFEVDSDITYESPKNDSATNPWVADRRALLWPGSAFLPGLDLRTQTRWPFNGSSQTVSREKIDRSVEKSLWNRIVRDESTKNDRYLKRPTNCPSRDPDDMTNTSRCDVTKRERNWCRMADAYTRET
jgi:hypothetical protein